MKDRFEDKLKKKYEEYERWKEREKDALISSNIPVNNNLLNMNGSHSSTSLNTNINVNVNMNMNTNNPHTATPIITATHNNATTQASSSSSISYSNPPTTPHPINTAAQSFDDRSPPNPLKRKLSSTTTSPQTLNVNVVSSSQTSPITSPTLATVSASSSPPSSPPPTTDRSHRDRDAEKSGGFKRASVLESRLKEGPHHPSPSPSQPSPSITNPSFSSPPSSNSYFPPTFSQRRQSNYRPNDAYPPKQYQNRPDDGSENSVFIAGLKETISDNDLYQAFQQFGEILSVRIINGKNIAFVKFRNGDRVQEAIDSMNGKEINGSILRTARAKGFNRNHSQRWEGGQHDDDRGRYRGGGGGFNNNSGNNSYTPQNQSPYVPSYHDEPPPNDIELVHENKNNASDDDD